MEPAVQGLTAWAGWWGQTQVPRAVTDGAHGVGRCFGEQGAEGGPEPDTGSRDG